MRRVLIPTGIAAVIAAIAGTALYLNRGLLTPFARRTVATNSSAPARTDTLTSTAQLAAPSQPAPGATIGSAAPTPPASLSLALADPQDSALAAAFAIRLGTYPSYAEALRVLRQRAVRRGAATITPVAAPAPPTQTVGGAPPSAHAFMVFVGAAQTAAALRGLARAIGDRSSGPPADAVTRTPYALRLTLVVPLDSARRATIEWRSRGIPAYALTDSGQATVYAGAFASPDEALPLAASLRAAGLAPTLGYRVGQAP